MFLLTKYLHGTPQNKLVPNHHRIKSYKVCSLRNHWDLIRLAIIILVPNYGGC